MLVRELIGKRAVNDGVGLELEVESENQLPDIRGGWVAKPDGSLRLNGMEYVSDGPVPVNKDKLKFIENLTDILKGYKVLKDSPRTSFHVHVNCRDHTLTEAFTAACCYWLVDNIMTRYCGEDREGNIFCLRLRDAEDTVKIVTHALNSNQRVLQNFGGNIRYSSQNLAALASHGTLEYRTMRGTTDPVLMDKWSTALHKMVNRAKEYKRPDAFMDAVYEDRGYDKTVNNLFGWDFAQEIKCKNWRDMIEENVGLVTEVAYHHNWEKWEAAIDKNYKAKYKGLAADLLVADGVLPEPAGVRPEQVNIFGAQFRERDVAAQPAPIAGRPQRRAWDDVVQNAAAQGVVRPNRPNPAVEPPVLPANWRRALDAEITDRNAVRGIIRRVGGVWWFDTEREIVR